jgi:hypothetical protein
VHLVGCSFDDSGSAPETLADGSKPPRLQVELEGGGEPAVLTRVQAGTAGRMRRGTLASRCAARRPEVVPADAPAVTRTGVDGQSVTIVVDNGAALVACERTSAFDGAWCGSAHGMLHEGRLRDPRLDLGCATGENEIGLLWITPLPTTAFVAVPQPGYVEVYPVASRLPVRVATHDVETEGSRAAATYTEHDVRGRLLRRSRVEASVAG